MKLTLPIAKGYFRNQIASLALQLVLSLLGLMTLDGGQLAMWIIYSMAVYWPMAVIIAARRPKSPTKGDLIGIRYGFIFILIGIVCLTTLRWIARGPLM